jgi:hypothetical protein
MKTSTTPKTSPLKIDIENKISNTYLFSIAAKSRHLNLNKLLKEHLTAPSPNPLTVVYKSLNK